MIFSGCEKVCEEFLVSRRRDARRQWSFVSDFIRHLKCKKNSLFTFFLALPCYPHRCMRSSYSFCKTREIFLAALQTRDQTIRELLKFNEKEKFSFMTFQLLFVCMHVSVFVLNCSSLKFPRNDQTVCCYLNCANSH